MNEQFYEAGTLVIFSLGSPIRVEYLASQFNLSEYTIFWVDPFAGSYRTTINDDFRKLEIVEGVLCTKNADLEIFKFSLPELYSVSPCTSILNDLFPGLEVTKAISVPAVTEQTLASRLAGLCGPLTVMIDFPGQEHELLSFLDSSGLMLKVETLYLRAGVEPFFENSYSAIDLVQMLESHAFSAGEIFDHTDLDWPVYRFTADQRTRLVSDLRAQLDDLAQERNTFEKAATELHNKLAQSNDTLARNTKEIGRQNVELQRLTKERDAAKAAAVQSREDLAEKTLDVEVRSKKIESLEKEIDKVQKALAEARDRLAQHDDTSAQDAQTIKELNKKIAQLAEDVRTRDKEAERLTTELAAQDEIVSQHKQSADLQAKEIQQLTKERDAGQGKVAQLEEALKKLRKDNTAQHALNTEKTRRLSYEAQQLRLDLRRATAVQQTLQSEKDILRSSNKDIEEENQKLRQLLHQLTPKLREAAEQVRKITSPPQASSILDKKSTKSPTTRAEDINE